MMEYKRYKFKKIDAFATEKSSGNPAGCICLDNARDINKNEMQQIAEELKGFVNEVGFVHSIESDQFQLQFYSSERRVDFCGHAIVGIMYDLILNHPNLQDKESVSIITEKGESRIVNRIQSDNSMFVMAPEPKPVSQMIPLKDICRVLQIRKEDLNTDYSIEMINAGLNTLIVPIQTLATTLDINPGLNTLKQFCIDHQIDIIVVFTTDVFSKENKVRSRVFAPTFGYLEDPATGSGNSALGYYMLEHQLWDGQMISVEQNGFIERYNVVKLFTKPDSENRICVFFGGGAIKRVEGEYRLYS